MDFGFWLLDFGFGIWDLGFWTLDFGFWLLGELTPEAGGTGGEDCGRQVRQSVISY